VTEDRETHQPHEPQQPHEPHEPQLEPHQPHVAQPAEQAVQPNRATGIGSMPGDDYRESLRIVLGEIGDFPHLVELPARGPVASMIGRTLALVSDLGADLQPAGWRLTDAPGIDHRRARSLLAQDLDSTEELTQGHTGAFKLQIAGPWTLAATVERPRGDKVLGDHGARRDLAQALAEGLRDHVSDVQRRIGAAQLVVQVDEPALPSVLGAAIPTASGFSRHRSVAPAAASQALGWVLDAVVAAGAEPVVHCCAPEVPLSVVSSTAAAAISIDLSLVTPSQYDGLAAWVEEGRQVWAGVVPSTDPTGKRPAENELTRQVLAWWAQLGFTDLEKLPATTVTPTCGLAGASPGWARSALALSHQVARNLSVEQGKIEP
jgi:methionine synthase II (cobalamin-independent)